MRTGKKSRRGVPLRRWTAGENRLLGTLPDAELARRLKRGVSGVEQQRLKLGISFRLSEAELVRLLIAAGADVQVLMTHSATQFIGPLTLETLIQRITGHIPHHLQFIEEKKKALQA